MHDCKWLCMMSARKTCCPKEVRDWQTSPTVCTRLAWCSVASWRQQSRLMVTGLNLEEKDGEDMVCVSCAQGKNHRQSIPVNEPRHKAESARVFNHGDTFVDQWVLLCWDDHYILCLSKMITVVIEFLTASKGRQLRISRKCRDNHWEKQEIKLWSSKVIVVMNLQVMHSRHIWNLKGFTKSL